MAGDIAAVAVFTLDATQVSEQVAQTNAALQGLEATTTSAGAAISGMAPLTFELGTAFDQLTKKQQTAADTAVSYEQAEARLAVAQGDYASAARILSTVLEEGVASAGKLAAVETQLEGVHTRAAAAAVQEAQAEARLAAAQGDRIGAIGILQSAEQNIVGITERQTLALETQAATLSRGTLTMTGFGQAGASAFTSVLGPMALLTAGMAAFSAVQNEVSEGLKLVAYFDATKQELGALYGDVQKGSQVFAAATAEGQKYGFTQKQIADTLNGLRPILRDSTASTKEQVDALAKLQFLNPKKPIEDLGKAIEGLVSGRAGALAKDLGLDRAEMDQLTRAVRSGVDPFVALNRVLDQHGVTLAQVATRMQGAQGAALRLQLAQENLANAVGRFAQGPAVAAQNALTGIETDAAKVVTAVGTIGTAFDGFTSRFEPLNRANTILTGVSQNIERATGFSVDLGGAITNLIAPFTSVALSVLKLNGVLLDFYGWVARILGILPAQTDATNQQTAATQTATDATNVHADATNNLTGLTQAETTALVDEIEKKQKSALTTQALTGLQTDLANIAPAVAAGLLNDANAAQGLANKYGIAADAARDLIRQQEILGEAKANAALGARPGAGISYVTGALSAEGEQANVKATQDAIDAAHKLNEARANQILTTGTAAQKEAELRREMDAAATHYGQNSAEYINAQTKLIKAEEEADKAHKARKGRAGGGTKLSDQQRLDNSLISQQQATNDRLANAQTADDQKMEKLALEHDRKLSEIDEAYRAKELQAEQDFQQKSLDGRAGFYENLINMQGKQGQKVAREMAAQYEQAVTKSAQIGREKGADAGIAYMDAATAAIEKEGKLKEEINNALYGDGKKGKDKARAEALQGVLQLQQNADNLRLSLVEQSGSKLAQEHSAQIASENERYSNQLADQTTKYADQQQRIQTLSDQAAQRKEDNAVRGKKAVDVETAALAYQNTVLQQNVDIAAKSGARPVNPSAAPSAVPSSGVIPIATQADSSALLNAVQSLGTKLDSLLAREGDTTNAAQAIADALKSTLQTRVTNFPSAYGRQLS